MYCQPPKSLRKANTVFERFCREIHVLPPDTPIFLIDSAGHIVFRKRLEKTAFESIYSLIDESQTESFQSHMTLADAFVAEGKDSKDYVVVSKDEYGFSRCVICSSSEKGSIGLHDYALRLCSYRDYLESFENLVVSPLPRMPVKWLFGLKISGVIELMDLARAERDADRIITFPLMLGLEKLCRFIQKVNRNRTELLTDGTQESIYVTAPEAFFKLVVSAAALAERFSRTGKVSISVGQAYEINAVRINIFTKGKGDEGDIFEKALVSAFETLGFYCGVVDSEDVYRIWFEVPVATPAVITVSDVAVISSVIDKLIENETVSALHFTISDK